jgi:vanillate O-demethylase monooxygenase subunit
MPAGQKCKSDPTRSAVARFMETFPAVIAEDRWALEKQQQMYEYPDDGYFEVFLRPDMALRRARLMLRRLERAETAAAPGRRATGEPVETPAAPALAGRTD